MRGAKTLAFFLATGIFCLFRSPVFAVEFVLSNPPETISLGESFSAHLVYENKKETVYYLRPCFFYEGQTNYFGCLQNHLGNWVCGYQEDKTLYLKIETDVSGQWSGDLQLKTDEGSGQLNLKICRYTATGTTCEYSNQVSFEVLPPPTFAPTFTPAPVPTPVLTSVPSTTPVPASPAPTAISATATPSPSSRPPTSSPTATLTPTPWAKWSISSPVGSEGESLPQVKIYLDGTYLHHYAPEDLFFCPGCSCGEVACGFGPHEISLEKTGYQSWVEEKEILAGLIFSSRPVLSVEGTTSSPATPTPAFSPSPSFSPTIPPSPSPTLSAASPFLSPGRFSLASPTASATGIVLGKTSAVDPTPFFIGGGLLFSGLAFFFRRHFLPSGG